MAARERYARVLRAPHARALLLAEIPARLPIGIYGLAIVLFVREHVGSYATAGAVAAAYGIALGLTSPLLGRLIDRRGPQRVVMPLAVAHTLAIAMLVAGGLTGAPAALLVLCSAAAGAFLPPLGSISRSLWPVILRDEDPGLLSTALALEGVLVELVFTSGPLLTAVLAITIDPAAALLVGPVGLLGGLALFLAQPPMRAWTVSEHASGHGALGALRSPGIRTIVLCTAPMGFCFGVTEVTMPAFAEAHGHRPAAGVLLSIWAIGSAAGGIAYGARAWSMEPARLYARLAAVLPLGYLPLAAAPSLAAMGPLALAAGLSLAPTITAGNQVAGDVAPAGAETESYTWLTMSLVGGLALGNAAAGAIVSWEGWQTAFLTGAGTATLGALLATRRWRTLRPS